MTISWGYKITFVYIGFVCFMLGMVTLCMMQEDIFLVEKEYYKEEIAYQGKIDKMNTTARLNSKVSFRIEKGFLAIAYPSGVLPERGDLWLFRPSNANLDVHIPAASMGVGVQKIPIATLAPGLWHIKLDWESHGSRYFHEEVLNIPKSI